MKSPRSRAVSDDASTTTAARPGAAGLWLLGEGRGPERRPFASRDRVDAGASAPIVPHALAGARQAGECLEMMRYQFGTTVHTADSADVGKIDRLIIDPRTRRLQGFVVRSGLLAQRDVVIPVGLVLP